MNLDRYGTKGASGPSAEKLCGGHIAALDGLRGVAILLVLFYHYGASGLGFGMTSPILSMSHVGWIGVDLFFVLSGFLITGILYDSRTGPRYLRNFYVRRILRIFPLYFTALIIVMILSVLWSSAGIWGTANPLWIALFLTNAIAAFAGPDSVGVLGHFWSLAIEEHFYLFWPFVVAWGSRRRLVAVCLSIIILSFTARCAAVLYGLSPDAVYFLTPFRIDALAAGAVISLAIRGPLGIEGLIIPAWVLGSISLVCLLVLTLLCNGLPYSDPMVQMLGYSLLALMFGSVILIGLTWSPATTLFENSILRWFGKYSYGLYVWHPIVNSLLFYAGLKELLGIDNKYEHSAFLVLGFSLSVAVALLSYHLLEMPFLRLKKYFPSKGVSEDERVVARRHRDILQERKLRETPRAAIR